LSAPRILSAELPPLNLCSLVRTPRSLKGEEREREGRVFHPRDCAACSMSVVEASTELAGAGAVVVVVCFEEFRGVVVPSLLLIDPLGELLQLNCFPVAHRAVEDEVSRIGIEEP
jgi:hypothetical protein